MPFLDRDTPLAAKIYISCLITFGLAVISYSTVDVFLSWYDYSQHWLIILLLILTAAGSIFPIRIPAKGRHQGILVTWSDWFLFTAMLHFGPTIAVCLVAVDASLANLRVRSSIKTFGKAFFNICQMALVTFLATEFFFWVYGQKPILHLEAASATVQAGTLLASLAWATLVFYVLNSAAVGTAMALVTGKSIWEVWKSNLLWTSLSNVTGASIAAIVVLYGQELTNEDVYPKSFIVVVLAIGLTTYYIYLVYRNRMEKLVQRSVFLQSILNSVSAYIAILDEAGKIIAVNRAWGAFSGRHQLIGPIGSEGENLVELLSNRPESDADTAQLILEGIRQTARSRDSKFSMEYSCSQGQETYWFDLQVNRFLDDARVRVVVEFADITRSKNLEEQLRHAQKMEAIGRLAGGVAHDFNNILTIISGYATFLQEALGKDPKLSSHVDTILEASDRAGAVTRQLLAFSRKQVLEPQVVELNSLVADTEKLLRRLIGEDIELVTLFDPEAGRIRVDPGQFAQVLINLAVNSRDAMPSGGHLRVETSSTHLTHSDLKTMKMKLHSGDYACLRVRDTGEGMDREILDHIFEPFYTTKEKGKGTGLGLSTVYGIVKQSGGDIDVASVRGKGTVFEIYLPQVLEGVLQQELLDAPAKAGPAPGRPIVDPGPPPPLGEAPPEPVS